jgi:hypothetical protein
MSTTISGTNGVTFPDSTSMQTGQQACKAWVNFNGTGTVAIRGSYNVSSITDTGTGNYTVNFTTVMVDGNYSASGATSNDGTLRFDVYTAGSIRVVTNAATADAATVSVAIFSN